MADERNITCPEGISGKLMEVHLKRDDAVVPKEGLTNKKLITTNNKQKQIKQTKQTSKQTNKTNKTKPNQAKTNNN